MYLYVKDIYFYIVDQNTLEMVNVCADHWKQDFPIIWLQWELEFAKSELWRRLALHPASNHTQEFWYFIPPHVF